MASTVYHFGGSASLSGIDGNYTYGTFTIQGVFGAVKDSSGATIYNEDGGPYAVGGIVSDSLGPGAPTTFPGSSRPSTVALAVILAPGTYSPPLPAGAYTITLTAIYSNGLSGPSFGENLYRITFAFNVAYGCTDSTATNYDPGATVDDGSCTYGGGTGGGSALYGVCNVGQDVCVYHTARADHSTGGPTSGQILYSRADRAAPFGGFDITDVSISIPPGTDTDTEPRLVILPDGTVRCFFNRSGSSYYADSSADGLTWGTPVLILPGCTHPCPASDPTGTLIVLGYAGGNLKGTVQAIGDTGFSTPVTILDDTGTALSVIDDSFGFTYTFSGYAGWVLVATVTGDSGPSAFICYDEVGLGFKKIV